MTRPATLICLLSLLVLLTGCPSRTAPRHNTTTTQAPTFTTHDFGANDRLAARRGPQVARVNREPVLRIRIGRSLTDTTIGAAGSVTVGPGSRDQGRSRAYTYNAPIRITHDGQGFVLTDAGGSSVRWALSSIAITGPGGRLTLDGEPYPGSLELVSVTDRNNRRTRMFDVVNRVGMESYLPGVLSQELYASWDIDTYRAQAIAARSYAIWEMGLPIRRGSHFDLEAGQASQAYIGDRANATARQAVADTAGQVLVYDSRVLPAFYSSCSGGTGQDAYAVWPEKVDNLAPLQGRNHGGWGQNSNRYRWGPVARDRLTLSRRIALWGRADEHPVARMGVLRAVQVTGTNSIGRPTQVRLLDDRGVAFTLSAEDLRMATNFRAASLPEITRENMVFSSHSVWAFSGNTVTIAGRGFGHGVGLCQFGAQQMATQGHSHTAILGFYYPGVRLQRAY